jgi:tetratricopeptide (TPR) repeat protein
VAGKKRKQLDPAAVRAEHDRAARLNAAAVTLLYALAFVAFVALAMALNPPLALVGTASALLAGAAVANRTLVKRRLGSARSLVERGEWNLAISDLKELQALRRGAVADEATYLVALAYDRQGALKLALECYRLYLSCFPRGVWRVEAKVRFDELEAAGPPVKARAVAVQTTCPYCKADLLPDSPVVECAACGTAHHAGCYEEQRGCAVYGCESKTARARVQS